jgi:cysteine desulfurase
VHGGPQEGRRRAGTENVAAIVGFGAAAECAVRDLPDVARLAGLRDRLEREAMALSDRVTAFSATRKRLANTSAMALVGAKAETMVIQLDLAGIAVSAGSACSSGKASPSHVLRATHAMGELVEATFRVSLGWNSTDDDVDAFLDAFADIVRRHEMRAAGTARAS